MPNANDKIGALWIRESRGGTEYMSGEVEIDGRKHRVTVFRNSYRTDANRQPNYIIYRDQQLSAPTAPAGPVGADEIF